MEWVGQVTGNKQFFFGRQYDITWCSLCPGLFFTIQSKADYKYSETSLNHPALGPKSMASLEG
jgi:hypothetical protein